MLTILMYLTRAKKAKALAGSCLLLLLILCTVQGETPSAEVTKLLPSKVGGFTQVSAIQPLKLLADEGILKPEIVNPELLGAESEYQSARGERFLVEFVRLRSDADAYSLLTVVAKFIRDSSPGANLLQNSDVGTASVRSSTKLAFFKGSSFVRISATDKRPPDPGGATELARLFADQIDKGEADIPPLVKHLPDGDETQKNTVFLSRFRSLAILAPGQQVLAAISGEGDADAVIANYGPSKVLIVEFNTPQLATENDQRIIAKIHDLWNQGLPAPTAYRRVGNYSVFVFDAPDEKTAKQLIDGVKYEQVVQWLGDNPYLLKEAERRYVDTTLGVFIAVLKASGFALIGCFATGGLFGALLFSRRRKQQKAVEAFSDAGGMLRLNIDELTPQTNPSRLLRERN